MLSLHLHSADEFRLISNFHFANFTPHQHGAVGIRLTCKSAGALEDGTQLFPRPDPVSGRMHDLTVDFHRRSDVIPSGNLANGQNISAAERQVLAGVAV